MMQRLLAERFHLVFHKESRPAQAYELVIGKNGPKLRTPQPDATRGIQGRPGQITGSGTSMAVLATHLSQRVGSRRRIDGRVRL